MAVVVSFRTANKTFSCLQFWTL